MWIIYYLLKLYVALPSSKAITSLTIDDFEQTTKWLLIVMCIVVSEQLVLYLENRIYHIMVKDVWAKINQKLYDKIERASQQSFISVSKEKIVNIIYNNIADLSDFSRNCAKNTSYFLQLITTILILFLYNWIIGISILGLCILVYVIKYFLHKKISFFMHKYYTYQDKMLENISDNYFAHIQHSTLDNGELKRQAYSKNLEKCALYKYKFGMLYCFDQVWLEFLCHILVSILCIFMVHQVENSLLTITYYLIISNYLSQAISQIIFDNDIISCINATYISALRIKTILDIKPENLLAFGDISTNNIEGELVFKNVSYSSNSKSIPDIRQFNMSITKHSASLICGPPNCGKRAIYKMLNRCITPTSGTITIDNINIYHFDKETYKHNIAFVPRKTRLFNDSIMNNLLVSGASKERVYQICKKLKLHQQIINLQQSYSTNLFENKNALSSFCIYLIGVARAIATSAEILVFYDFPSDLDNNERQWLSKTLKHLSKTHTLLIFSHDDWAKFACNTIYYVDNGKVTKLNS